MKIVINRVYGGFGLSHKAMVRYAEIKGLNLICVPRDSVIRSHDYFLDRVGDDNFFWELHIQRTDPALIQTVEELGVEANSKYAGLEIVEIPDNVEWQLEESDGIEWIAEKHRTWPEYRM